MTDRVHGLDGEASRGLALALLLFCGVAYLAASQALTPSDPPAPPGVIWMVMLMKASAATCIGAYAIGALWLRRRGAPWRVGLSLAIAAWTALNLVVWTGAAFRAGEPVACAATTSAARFVEMPDSCRYCDTGKTPQWFCLLIGCW
jgi:hypothetical protein